MSVKNGQGFLSLETIVAALIELLLQGHTAGNVTPAKPPKSTKLDAAAAINKFANDPPDPGAFFLPDVTDSTGTTKTARQMFADRLMELVGDPKKFDQRGLNACGSAAFFNVWLTQDPVGAVNFATELFKRGQANIGSIQVKASADLLAQDYKLLQIKYNKTGFQPTVPETADWVMMSALRDGTRPVPRFLGIPDDDDPNSMTGFFHPQEICDFLKATGVYFDVLNNADAFGQQDIAGFKNPEPDATHDVILLMHARMLHTPNLASGSGCTCEQFVAELKGLNALAAKETPDHYVVLIKKVEFEDKGDDKKSMATLNFWCWGDSYNDVPLRTLKGFPMVDDSGQPCKCMPYKVNYETFKPNFYGAIIAVR